MVVSSYKLNLQIVITQPPNSGYPASLQSDPAVPKYSQSVPQTCGRHPESGQSQVSWLHPLKHFYPLFFFIYC